MGSADGKIYVYRWAAVGAVEFFEKLVTVAVLLVYKDNITIFPGRNFHSLLLTITIRTLRSVLINSQHGGEICPCRYAYDTQQSHRRLRLQHGRPLRALNVPGETLRPGWHYLCGYLEGSR